MPAPVQDGLNQLTAEFGAVDLLWVVAELVDERGPQAAWCAGPVRSGIGRHDPLAVRHLDGIERVGVDDALLPFASDSHLGRSEKAGAQARTLGTERQRGGQPAAVGDAARRHHGYLPGDVDDLRDQHDRRDEAPVTAALTALGDDHIRSRRGSLLRLVHIDHLLEPHDPGIMRPRDQVGGHREVKRHHRGPERKRCCERLLVQRACGVVDRERPVCQPAQPRPLLTQLPDRAHRGADTAQRARLAHRGGEFDLLPRPERGTDDRCIDPEQVTKGRTQHGGPPDGSGLVCRPWLSPAMRSRDVAAVENG